MKTLQEIKILFLINIIAVFDINAQDNIKNYKDTSTAKVIEKKIIQPLKNNGYILIEDTIFWTSTNSLDDYKKHPNWKYDFGFLYKDGIEYFDSANTVLNRFAIRMTSDSINRTVDFTIDGFTYGEKIFVNHSKYCIQKLGGDIKPSQYFESSFDSILKQLNIKYGFKYNLTEKWQIPLYRIKIPNFSKHNLYWISYEIQPVLAKFDGAQYKNSGNSIVSRKNYIEIDKCNCSEYDLIVLIRDYANNKSNHIKTYSSIPVDYLILRYRDLRIIEKGTFSIQKQLILD